MDWETFYDRWENWSDSTLISRISSLKSIGPSNEIVEVACSCLCFDAANKLIVKAVKLGAKFSFNELIELDECDYELAEHILDNCACTLTPTQAKKLEELDYAVPEACIAQVKSKRRTSQKRERAARQEEGFSPLLAALAAPELKRGFFDKLFGAKPKRGKSCRCSGDCANCPPHYGYRYGRWYYGHGHTHGCEFGGNKGDGDIRS